MSTLRFFPGLHKDFEATGYYASGLSFYAHSGRQVIAPRPAAWDLPGSVHAARDVKVAWIRRRADLSIAMDAQLRRLGICVEYGKKVVKYDEDETKGFVRTEDGHTYYADLVVAADGIGTKSHHHITGHEAPAMSSGYAVFRGKIPLDCLQNASREAQDKYHPGPNPEFRLYLA